MPLKAIINATPAERRQEKRPKTRLRIYVIVGLLAVVVILVGIKASQILSMIRAGKAFVPPPESVTTAKVETFDWLPTRPAVGSLVAVHGVTLGSEVTGIIREIGFESGASVKRGALLVKLDTSTEEAQLASSVADAALARVTLARAVKLRQTEANSQADLDAAQAHFTQTEAAVLGLRATIAKKTIRAPFAGRVGIRQVELGQSVSPGTPLASLQSVDPIYAEFSLPQQVISELKLGQPVRMQTDIFQGAKWDGAISTINPEVDVSTRNVRIRATIPNQDGRLRPGMFVNVEVLSANKRRVLVIPATAVMYAPYGDSLFVVEEKSDPSGHKALSVRQKFVRLGDRRGDLIVVESGVNAGETVVSTGAFKLRNGMNVVVKNDLAPKVEIAPQPSEN